MADGLVDECLQSRELRRRIFAHCRAGFSGKNLTVGIGHQ
jgi:hypothetical protein